MVLVGPTHPLRRGTSQRCPHLPPRKATPSEALRGEGSSRWRDKIVSWPRSMRDLCRVRARSKDEPFLAQEMIDLPAMFGDDLLEARWAILTRQSKVWAEGADAQLFYRGVLCPPLAKEIYTTPSEALLDNAVKNLVARVVDELSRVIDELRAKVQKLKDETGLIAMTTVEARASESIE
ncbi:hypothetical protein BHE74_00023062 [Ensete ventricosum]|nr:hypothetical protein BHE74_00023062 [Ensete ventricosum]